MRFTTGSDGAILATLPLHRSLRRRNCKGKPKRNNEAETPNHKGPTLTPRHTPQT